MTSVQNFSIMYNSVTHFFATLFRSQDCTCPQHNEAVQFPIDNYCLLTVVNPSISGSFFF